MKHLVLLGAGEAHLSALLQWGQEGLATAQVTLVAPLEKQAFSAMVPGHLAGHFQADELMIPVAELAKAAKVRWVVGSVASLNATERTVTLTDGRPLAYDVLSIDTGGAQDRGLIPGAREHAMWVRPTEPFLNFAEQMFEISRERELDVVVMGGGATGVELALAMQWRFDAQRAAHGRSRVTLVAGLDGVLPRHPESVRRAATSALASAKVVVFNENGQSISSDHVHLGNGARLACDAPVMCTGDQPAAWLKPSGLTLDDAGFVCTEPTLQSVSHPNVFVVAGAAARTAAPQGQQDAFAALAGKTLAANLRAYVGAGPLAAHQAPPRAWEFLTFGKRSAVAHWGPYAVKGPWVWWWKRRRDKAYVQVCRNGLKPPG